MPDAAWLTGCALLAAALAGCQESADSFFSGRPSGMAMAHNRILEGSLESMVDLLRIPQRFPQAAEPVLAALPKLTAPEMHSLEGWAALHDSSRDAQKAAAMAAFREALRQQRAGKT